MNKLIQALKLAGVGLKHVATVAGIAAVAGVATQVTSDGIDQTALAALPPLAKLSIAVAAPVVLAWLKRSPRQ